VVAKEVEEHFMLISADLCMCKMAEEAREVAEDADKLRRENNIVIFSSPESKLQSTPERIEQK
jgi:hypothetical protein